MSELYVTDRAVVAFLASLARVLGEIDKSQAAAATSGESHADLLVSHLRYYLLEGLHRDVQARDREAMERMIDALDYLRAREQLIPMSETSH